MIWLMFSLFKGWRENINIATSINQTVRSLIVQFTFQMPDRLRPALYLGAYSLTIFTSEQFFLVFHTREMAKVLWLTTVNYKSIKAEQEANNFHVVHGVKQENNIYVGCCSSAQYDIYLITKKWSYMFF